MIASRLGELIAACLLRDVIYLDAQRKKTGINLVLTERYGITGTVIVDIVSDTSAARSFPADSPVHMIRYIDKNYLQLPQLPVWKPLRSVFFKEEDGSGVGFFHSEITCYSEKINYPDCSDTGVPDEVLDRLCDSVATLCREEYGNASFLSQLIDRLENYGTYLSPDGGVRSLFEIVKLRAGLVSCIYLSLEEKGVDNYASFFSHPEEGEQTCVLVCSLDFLGIKDFKFQPAFADRLDELTAASFYIDLFRENVLDDLLAQIGITRCNLIFSGGRHLHLFLPNTSRMKEIIENQMRLINDWLVNHFQLDLYISYGMYPASLLDRFGSIDEKYYLEIFTRITNQKALIEAKKYSAENLLRINRELSESSEKRRREKRKDIVRQIANTFVKRPYIVIFEKNDEGVMIGPNRYAVACKEIPADQEILRIYVLKHDDRIIPAHCPADLVRIWYQEIFAATMNLGDQSMSDMGIFRMDIDNFRNYMLGRKKEEVNADPPNKMELSKQFAMFLRRDIPRLLRQYKIQQTKEGRVAAISVIHEGADDIFIFGQIRDLSAFARIMYMHYRKYTCETMSFSAGISLYDPTESFAVNAGLAQQLLDDAKKIPGKDGVVFRDCTGTFKWKDFMCHGFDH